MMLCITGLTFINISMPRKVLWVFLSLLFYSSASAETVWKIYIWISWNARKRRLKELIRLQARHQIFPNPNNSKRIPLVLPPYVPKWTGTRFLNPPKTFHSKLNLIFSLAMAYFEKFGFLHLFPPSPLMVLDLCLTHGLASVVTFKDGRPCSQKWRG